MLSKTTIDRLRLSETNVRKTYDARGINAMAASIDALGLIHPLTVTEAADGAFEVVAGGRRLRAIKQLIEDGVLTDAFEITIDVLDAETNPVELSLAENVQREPMAIADEVIAFRQLIDEGYTAEQIADRFGYALLTVQQRLALANLHPTILESLRAGEMNLSCARAFTLSLDQERQLAVFEQLSRIEMPKTDPALDLIDDELLDEDDVQYDLAECETDEERAQVVADFEASNAAITAKNAERATKRAELGIAERRIFNGSDWQVKRALSEDAVTGKDARAKLIGTEAFTEAGGVIVVDLFETDGDLWKPESLLNDLAEAKMAVACEEFKAEGGWKFVRGLLSHYIPYDGLGGLYDLHGHEHEAAEVGRILLLSNAGVIEPCSTLYTDVRPKGSASSSSSSSGSSPADDLSARAIRELAYMRREILQIELMRHPKIAHGYAVFMLVDKLVSDRSYGERGSTISPTGSYESDGLTYGSEPQAFREQPTAAVFAELEQTLNRTWLTNPDSDPKNDSLRCFLRFERFLALTDEERELWAAYGVARTLKISCTSIGQSIPFHDHLGAKLAIDVRAHSTPGVENYWTYATKGQMLAALAPWPETAKVAAKMKGGEAREFLAALCNAGHPDHPEAAAGLAGWVPPTMRFYEAPAPKSEKAKKPAKAAAKPKAPAKKKVAEPA